MEQIYYEIKPFLLGSFGLYAVKGNFGMVALTCGTLLVLLSGLIAWWRVQNRLIVPKA